MTETRYYCDFCSSRVAAHERTSLAHKVGPDRHRYPVLDACPSCWADIIVARLSVTGAGEAQCQPLPSVANRVAADPGPPRRVAVPRTASHSPVLVVPAGD